MPINQIETKRREAIRQALYRAEGQFAAGEVCEVVGISNQQYTQFKSRLYLGRKWLSKLEDWLVLKGFLPKQSYEIMHINPPPPLPILQEISEMLGSMRSVAEKFHSVGCTVSDLQFLQVGARHLADSLIPRATSQIENTN